MQDTDIVQIHGLTFWGQARLLRNTAIAHNCDVKGNFEGVDMIVTADTNLRALHRDYQRVLSGKINGPIGPHPVKKLSEADKELDEQMRKANLIGQALPHVKALRQGKASEHALFVIIAVMCELNLVPQELGISAAELEKWQNA